MTSAEDHESIANEVYRVDPLKQKPPLHKGDAFYTDNDPAKQQWQVVKVSAHAKDGFQAMLVLRPPGAADPRAGAAARLWAPGRPPGVPVHGAVAALGAATVTHA